MALDGAGSVYAIRMRACLLDTDGSPLVGPKSMYVTDSMIKADFTPNYEDGDDITQKNGSGVVCLSYTGPATLKNYSGSLTICVPDPELYSLLTGGTILTDSGESVGWASPEVGVDPMPDGVSIEYWSRAIVGGGTAGTKPYYHWLFPRVKMTPDQVTLEAGALQPEFNYTAETNPNWGAGPVGDWTHASDRIAQFVRTSTLPASQLGLQAVAAA